MMVKRIRDARSTGERTAMKTRKCPMCQCEQFYKANLISPGVGLSLGFLKGAVVHCLVCLDCGFAAPHVDQAGLEAIREKAKKEGRMIDGNPGKEELREL
jgi:hypothetical protein